MCENIFNSYQPETIRKYWIGLSDKQLDKVIQVVNKIKTFKDDFNVKLKSLIEFITEFLKGKVDSNFEEALIRLYDKEKKSSFLLRKKRIREGFCKRKKFIGINNPFEHLFGKRFDNKDPLKPVEYVDKKSYFILNEIIDSFKEAFNKENFSDLQILNALYLNSMNIKKAYQYLRNPSKAGKKKTFLLKLKIS